MTPETLLIAILFCAAIIPILAVVRRVRVAGRFVTGSVLVLWLGFALTIVLTTLVYRKTVTTVQPARNRPIEVKSDGYVGSDTCRSCHPHQHATWHASYHRTMTQVATPETVIPSVNDIAVKIDGLNYRLKIHNDKILAEMEFPVAGESSTVRQIDRPIVMTTGSHHMQIFWFPVDQHRQRMLGMFPVVYLTEQNRWIPRRAAFLTSERSIDIEGGRWNNTCIKCHATFGRARPEILSQSTNGKFTLKHDVFDTHVAELGIACESCHGPSEKHVMANRNPTFRYVTHLTGRDDSSIVNPAKLSHRRTSQVCGQCHSVWLSDRDWVDATLVNGFPYKPGEDLHKSKYRLIVEYRNRFDERTKKSLEDGPGLLETTFWSDGMVRVSGREYTGLLDTPCFQRGEMSCLSCHTMHQSIDDDRELKQWANDQLKVGMEGNLACVQCHQDFENDQTLTEHTHHAVGSSGSKCYNCHMPYTTYGLLKAIRSHQVDTPTVAASLETGRPNACNQCHLDKTLAWTSQYLSDWYAIEHPSLSEDERSVAASVMWSLSGDAGQRVLMAWSFGWREARKTTETDWIVPYLAQLLEDPYPVVRLIAERSLRAIEDYETISYNFWAPTDQLAAGKLRAMEIWESFPDTTSRTRWSLSAKWKAHDR